GPYQLMLGSKRQSFFSTVPRAGAGTRTLGRLEATPLASGAANDVAGPTDPAEPCAVASRVDAAAWSLGRATETALRSAGSSDRSGLGDCEPAGAGTATRADAAMRAANATTILVRTWSASLPEAVNPGPSAGRSADPVLDRARVAVAQVGAGRVREVPHAPGDVRPAIDDLHGDRLAVLRVAEGDPGAAGQVVVRDAEDVLRVRLPAGGAVAVEAGAVPGVLSPRPS